MQMVAVIAELHMKPLGGTGYFKTYLNFLLWRMKAELKVLPWHLALFKKACVKPLFFDLTYFGCHRCNFSPYFGLFWCCDSVECAVKMIISNSHRRDSTS